MRRDTPSSGSNHNYSNYQLSTINTISQTRQQRCRIQSTSVQSRLLQRLLQPRFLYRVNFRHPSHQASPHTTTGGQVVYRSDTIVVLVRGCNGGHGSCCNLVLFGHISSSKAGFVQCFERREQFRRSVFFLWPPTGFCSRWSQKNTDLQFFSRPFPFFSAPIARFPRT